MRVSKKTWYAVGGVAAAALFFQLFLHYQYVHLAGGYVMRIDRLTGSACYMPCVASPSETAAQPSATSTLFNWRDMAASYALESSQQDQRAILLAKATAGAAAIVAREPTGYSWRAKTTDGSAQAGLRIIGEGRDPAGTLRQEIRRAFSSSTSSPDEAAREWRDNPPFDPHSPQFQTKIVCYCDSTGTGWRWEVHVDTGDVFFVNDNPDLVKKYWMTNSPNSAGQKTVNDLYR
jgi:hypothetical protein